MPACKAAVWHFNRQKKQQKKQTKGTLLQFDCLLCSQAFTVSRSCDKHSTATQILIQSFMRRDSHFLARNPFLFKSKCSWRWNDGDSCFRPPRWSGPLLVLLTLGVVVGNVPMVECFLGLRLGQGRRLRWRWRRWGSELGRERVGRILGREAHQASGRQERRRQLTCCYHRRRRGLARAQHRRSLGRRQDRAGGQCAQAGRPTAKYCCFSGKTRVRLCWVTTCNVCRERCRLEVCRSQKG